MQLNMNQIMMHFYQAGAFSIILKQVCPFEKGLKTLKQYLSLFLSFPFMFLAFPFFLLLYFHLSFPPSFPYFSCHLTKQPLKQGGQCTAKKFS